MVESFPVFRIVAPNNSEDGATAAHANVPPAAHTPQAANAGISCIASTNSPTAAHKTLPDGFRSRHLVPFAHHRGANAASPNARDKIPFLSPLGCTPMASHLGAS